MLHELKSITYTVKTILQNKEDTRDDDNKLIQEVWLKQFPGLLNMNSKRLLYHLQKKHLCSTKSIIRIRQKIQQDNVEFRGKYYYARQDKQEPQMRKFFKSKLILK